VRKDASFVNSVDMVLNTSDKIACHFVIIVIILFVVAVLSVSL